MKRLHALRTAATAAGGVLGLAAPALACPYCSLSQGLDTLVYILAFLAIPYAVVTVVMLCMKKVLAGEQSAGE